MSAPETIVLAGGGTAGHFYPALAVAESLRARSPDVDLHYIGTRQGIESRLAPASGFRFDAVSSGQVRGTGNKEVGRLTRLYYSVVRVLILQSALNHLTTFGRLA